MHNNEKGEPSIAEWLGFANRWKLSNAPRLGRLLGFLVLLVGIVAVFAAFAVGVHFLIALCTVNTDKGEAIRNTGLVIAAMFGAPFLVWRTNVAAKQTRVTEEALFNDKVNDAFRRLSARREVTRLIRPDGKEAVLKEWEDDLVTRAAAMDRVEGLVKERRGFAPRAVKMLASYVRGTFPAHSLEPTKDLEQRKTPRMDLQRAIDVIGRIYKIAADVDRSQWRLDLQACNFDGVSFSKGYFRAAKLNGGRFEAAILRDGNFEGCWFHRSLLNYAEFYKANLKGVKMNRVILNRPEIGPGGFGSDLNSAHLKGVTLISADISAVSYLGESSQVSQIFGTKDTVLSEDLKDLMLSPEKHKRAVTKRARVERSKMTVEDLNLVKN